jgi:hypothetical protein
VASSSKLPRLQNLTGFSLVLGVTLSMIGLSACSEPASLAATKTKPAKVSTKPKKSSQTSKPVDRSATLPIANRQPDPPLLVITTAPTPPDVFEARSDCRKLRLMPLGDSLTAFPESYRGPLFRNLENYGLKVDFVGSVSWAPASEGDADGEGHGGFTIGPDDRVDAEGKKANLADNLGQWVPAANPDVILLTIGTNDLAGGGKWSTEAPGKLAALVRQIRGLAPEAVLVVGDVPPSIYDPAGTTSTAEINAEANRIGNADLNDKIIYAMTSKRLLDLGFVPETDTADGVHFKEKGGELFAKAWEPSLREALRMIPKLC